MGAAAYQGATISQKVIPAAEAQQYGFYFFLDLPAFSFLLAAQ